MELGVLAVFLFVSAGFYGCAMSGDETGGSANWASDDDDGWGGGGGSGTSAGYSATAAGPTSGGGPDTSASTGGSNVSFGGSQDFGYFRKLLEAGQVPHPDTFDAAGFFAEHHTELPKPDCGNILCLQPMMAQLQNLSSPENTCATLQLGLNTPLAANPDDRPPLTLAVVVDVSGSMKGEKIKYVRDGLEMLIDGMFDGDKMALITYNTNATLTYPMTDVKGNRKALRDVAQGLKAGGGTHIYSGLEMGYQEALAAYDSGRQNRVILLSDGIGSETTQKVLNMSKGYNSQGLGITSVGLGVDFNVELMRDLALQGDGNFYFLENAASVEEVFVEELSYFTVPVAFDLEIDFEAGSKYLFGDAYGSPFWKNDSPQGGTLKLPSVFIAHRKSHDDVTEDGGRRGGGSALMIELFPGKDDGSDPQQAKIATVNLKYREPGTNKIITEQAVLNYPGAPWNTPAKGFFLAPNIDLMSKSFVMLNIYVGIEKACTLFHQDNFNEESVALLERLLAAVKDYNEELEGGMGDTDMNYDIELLEDLIEVLLLNMVPPPEDSGVPGDPWPYD
ncbi:VWA domain-containing protein [Endomicrobium sp. AH-315-J14]|nr:VWA domain-containing protein [Endomicrobium sp. AH-315-J14]